MTLSIDQVRVEYTLSAAKKRPREADAVLGFERTDADKPKRPRLHLSDLYARIDALPKSSAYQKRVLKMLCQVPTGRVSTYGAMARALGSSPRAVGNALRGNPMAPEVCDCPSGWLKVTLTNNQVPCHRIVAADGQLGGFKGDWGVKGRYAIDKLKLLRDEGVLFDVKGKVQGKMFDGFEALPVETCKPARPTLAPAATTFSDKLLVPTTRPQMNRRYSAPATASEDTPESQWLWTQVTCAAFEEGLKVWESGRPKVTGQFQEVVAFLVHWILEHTSQQISAPQVAARVECESQKRRLRSTEAGPKAPLLPAFQIEHTEQATPHMPYFGPYAFAQPLPDNGNVLASPTSDTSASTFGSPLSPGSLCSSTRSPSSSVVHLDFSSTVTLDRYVVAAAARSDAEAQSMIDLDLDHLHLRSFDALPEQSGDCQDPGCIFKTVFAQSRFTVSGSPTLQTDVRVTAAPHLGALKVQHTLSVDGAPVASANDVLPSVDTAGCVYAGECGTKIWQHLFAALASPNPRPRKVALRQAFRPASLDDYPLVIVLHNFLLDQEEAYTHAMKVWTEEEPTERLLPSFDELANRPVLLSRNSSDSVENGQTMAPVIQLAQASPTRHKAERRNPKLTLDIAASQALQVEDAQPLLTPLPRADNDMGVPSCPPAPHQDADPSTRHRLHEAWAQDSSSWNKRSPGLHGAFVDDDPMALVSTSTGFLQGITAGAMAAGTPTSETFALPGSLLPSFSSKVRLDDFGWSPDESERRLSA